MSLNFLNLTEEKVVKKGPLLGLTSWLTVVSWLSPKKESQLEVDFSGNKFTRGAGSHYLGRFDFPGVRVVGAYLVHRGILQIFSKFFIRINLYSIFCAPFFAIHQKFFAIH